MTSLRRDRLPAVNYPPAARVLIVFYFSVILVSCHDFQHANGNDLLLIARMPKLLRYVYSKAVHENTAFHHGSAVLCYKCE
ncbi:hypothetical protein E2C01_000991 [Portunus trituberculatus]|uniref:Uncharacterized protein n=1 Tax=Portunus trituberculatus TaxID=210409 RepID=A0A5B7CGN1_PORTR|nr:hypothetical protein [Portunus trituberculatus]